MCVYIYTYIYTGTYTYIYIYIYTHTQNVYYRSQPEGENACVDVNTLCVYIAIVIQEHAFECVSSEEREKKIFI